MRYNREEHCRFVRWLDRTAEKNPLLWLPCVILLAVILGFSGFVDDIKTVAARSDGEAAPIRDREVFIRKKPFAERAVAVALVMMFSFGMVPEYNGIISVEVFAEDSDSIKTNGQCGADVYWEYSDDNNLYLYGTGSMWDFSYSASFAADINAFDINKIIINEGITYIGSNSFSNCSARNITIPSSVTSIGHYAFQECLNLTGIIIPDNVLELGINTFDGCTSLTNAVIGENVEIISDCTFKGCSALTDITLSNNISYIGNYAFQGCSSLKNISIPEGVKTIGAYAFDNCLTLSSAVIPESVTDIYGMAFNSCTLLTIYGYSGSYAETYANENGIPFTAIGENTGAEKSFRIGRDNLSFSNSAENFLNKEIFGIHYGDYEISNDALMKLLNCVSNNTEKQYIINRRKKKWTGSCFGMTSVMLLGINNKLPQLINNNTSANQLPKPVDSDQMMDIINYYQLYQFLPIIEFNFLEEVYNKDYKSALDRLIDTLLQTSPLSARIIEVVREEHNGEENRSIKSDHEILLLNVISEGDDCYTIKCYDPNFPNEYTYLTLYKSYENKRSIEYNYGDNYSDLVAYYDYDILDKYNFFAADSYISKETYDDNLLLLFNNKLSDDITYLYANGYNVTPSSRGEIRGPFSTGATLLNNDLEDQPEYMYFIKKDFADDFKIVGLKNGGAELVLDNYSFSLTTSDALTLNVNDTTGNAMVTADEPSDFNLQLTSNNNFGGWKWFTVDVGAADSKQLELSPDKEGIVLSGDNLSNITIKANDELDDTTLTFSTDEEKVLISNSEENKLEIYSDTDNNGDFETLIADSSGTKYYVSIPKEVLVKCGDTILENGDTVNTGDILTITADIIDGLTFILKVNDIEISNGDTYTVGDKNVTITVDYSEITSPDIHDPTITPYFSRNIGQNNYENAYRCAHAIESYLTEKPNGTVERVEFINGVGVVVEKYFTDGKTISQKVIPAELARFGGYFSGKKYNFLVFGQDNPDLDENLEMIRIVKYTKNWNRLDSFSFLAKDSAGYAGIKDAETKDVFRFGTLRMAEAGDHLIVHTCHGMFNGHQSNMPFVITQSDMKFVKFAGAYCSHSLNQFVKTDPNFIYYLDHGDSFPRSVVLTKLPVDLSSVGAKRSEVLKINGEYDVYGNDTGVSIGGLELTDSGSLIAGNSVPQSNADTYDPYGQRNIFIIATSEDLAESQMKWLTNYSADVHIGNPCLVKINSARFAVMWEETQSDKTVIKYTVIDSNGNIAAPAVTINARLSDCQPILADGDKIMWYYTDNSSPCFVTIDINGKVISISQPDTHTHNFKMLSDRRNHWKQCEICGEMTDISAHTEDKGVVTIQPTAKLSGIRTYSCTVCGYVMRTEIIPALDDEHTHSFSSNWQSDKICHWHECKCGEKSDMYVHTEDNGIITIQPTATAAGIKTYSCAVCGYVIRTEAIPSIGAAHTHYFSSLWSADRYSHWHECECGKTSDMSAHIEDSGIVTVRPTEISEGTVTYSCRVCGYVMRTAAIPPTPAYPETTALTEEELVDYPIADDIEISLKCNLSGLSAGTARLITKKYFFDGSAIVSVSQTEASKDAASKAAANLNGGSEYNITYPFDITIYDTNTNEKMSLRDNGYITLEIPVPEALMDHADEISVYHIADGAAELLESSIIISDGSTKIHFTASKFSPFMFNVHTKFPVEDVASGAGATENEVPIDAGIPVTNGVSVPNALLPRNLRLSDKKHRYRILRKRKLSDLVFVY